MKRLVTSAIAVASMVATTGYGSECTEADLLSAAVTDATQYACKVPSAIVTNTPKSVGVYKQDGTFLCELSSATRPVNATNVSAASVVACNTGLTLLAVRVGKRLFWIDRNDVTLNTDADRVTCIEKAPARTTPTPNVSMGAGEKCKPAS